MEALYRKYRPRNFYEIEGQEHIKRLLKNALEKHMINHAYIFSGPRGTGKTTTARILAKSLNCEKNQFGEPCNECASCIAIDNGSHFDVIELDAASNRGIDEIRKIREGVNFTPVMGKYKVYIIDEVHMLTKEAFNALLKTLEEPPEHVVFILATTNPEKIPPTISSRCHILEFRNISLEDTVRRLKKVSELEGYDVSEDAIYKIAKRAAGGLRDALSLLEQIVRYSGGEVNSKIVDEALGLFDEVLVEKLINSVLSHDYQTVEEIISEVYIERGDFETFINQLIEKCIENGSKLMIDLASEFYNILKELKDAEEKLLISKLLFLRLTNIFHFSTDATANLSTHQLQSTFNMQFAKSLDAKNVESNVQNKFEEKEETKEIMNVTKEILDELMFKGDLSLFVGLSLAEITENMEKIEIVFDKSHQLSYEIIKEKVEEIKMLYKNKSGLDRKVEVVLVDEMSDPMLQRLKALLE
ncbi:MAG: DNA polymerase III subunit gamma/tau [Fervidobacterium sp.]